MLVSGLRGSCGLEFKKLQKIMIIIIDKLAKCLLVIFFIEILYNTLPEQPDEKEEIIIAP